VFCVTSEQIQYSDSRRELPVATLVNLYRSNHWSAADKPELLRKALSSSHSLVTAWSGETLVGLGNALSDGFMVAYYSHLLVLPECQGRGIGMTLMQMLLGKVEGFHQQILLADGRAIQFYRKCAFVRAGKTEPMWIYAGHDH
jgi:GNAT superfamily N-acetyltransferase